MPGESWQWHTGNSDSSSTYSTELSRLTFNHHDSFFFEDVDRQGANGENSRRGEGFSVYLDDTRLVVPPTPSDLNSSREDLHSSPVAVSHRKHTADRSIDRSSCGNFADQSGNTDSEGIKNFNPGVAAYPTFNDSAYSGQSSDDIADFNGRIAAMAHMNKPLPTSIERRLNENNSNQPDLEDYAEYPNRSRSSDRNQLNQVPQYVVQVNAVDISSGIENPSSVNMGSTGIPTYKTVNESLESSIKDSLDQKFEDAPDKMDTSDKNSNESRRTVSTSCLINERDSWPLRSSEQYPPLQPTLSKSAPSEEIDMDRMVSQLKNEAQSDISPISCSTRPTSTGFVPQDLKISQRGPLPRRDSTSRKPIPRSPSLLDKILVPLVPDYTAKEIPVLRSVGSPRPEQQDHVRQDEEKIEESQEQEHQSEKLEEVPSKPESAQVKLRERPEIVSRPEGLTYSQVDIGLETLKEFQDELRRKIAISNKDYEYDDGSSHDGSSYHDEKGHIPISIPFQRVDSNLIDSKLSTNFWQKFSIWRILLVFFGCILVPPFFFMMAAGQKAGFSDLRITKLITHRDYRAKVWKGFLWDIDVRWFRRLCLVMGIIETLGVFAAIAVGFGVGVGAE